MDQDTLLASQIEEGRSLVARIIQDGFPVKAAWWVKESDRDRWHLYLVSPVVDDEGIREAYLRLQALTCGEQSPVWIDPFQIELVGPAEQMGEAMEDYQSRHPSGRPVRHPGGWLGERSIEGAYIYPPITVPEQSAR